MSGAVPSGSGRPGAGPKRDLVFIDGLPVTLVFIDGLPARWSRRKPSTGLVPARQAAC
ncbi:hypothetical protein [Streptomyces sp. NPDC060333]|uniref:hypothetical protein n=1 Tax=Streptomyces sp. NPDC060333 TaxID=3347098 RepID=UPI00364A52EB